MWCWGVPGPQQSQDTDLGLPGAAAARESRPARAAHPSGAATAPLQQRFPLLSLLLSHCKTHIFISTSSRKAGGGRFWFVSQLDALISLGEEGRASSSILQPGGAGLPLPNHTHRDSAFSL